MANMHCAARNACLHKNASLPPSEMSTDPSAPRSKPDPHAQTCAVCLPAPQPLPTGGGQVPTLCSLQHNQRQCRGEIRHVACDAVCVLPATQGQQH
eukprot:3089361-Rhodomonas_salina.1